MPGGDVVRPAWDVRLPGRSRSGEMLAQVGPRGFQTGEQRGEPVLKGHLVPPSEGAFELAEQPRDESFRWLAAGEDQGAASVRAPADRSEIPKNHLERLGQVGVREVLVLLSVPLGE